MSATDELRRMLDERGVEWYEPTMKPNTTWFPDSFGINCRVKPWGEVLQVKRYGLTPKQAIAATLGGGECEYVIEDNMNESEGMGDVWFRCTNCNTTFDYYADDWLMKQNHCPHCGFKIRKAVSE